MGNEKTDNIKSKDITFFGSSVKYAGYYLQPRCYYREYPSMDGHMIIMLALVERANAYVWNVLHNIVMTDKTLYKGKIKQICNSIDNPKGNSYSPSAASIGMVFKGWLPKLRRDIDKNLQTPEKDWREGYANIMDYLDEALGKDIDRIKYAIKNEMLKRKIDKADMITELIICIILTDIYSECTKIIEEKVHGSRYALCGDPAKEESRQNALLIDDKMLHPLRMALDDLLGMIDQSDDFNLRDVDTVETGFVVLTHKLLSIELMAPACAAGGIDIRCEEYKELVDIDIEPEEASRRCVTRNNTYYEQRMNEIDAAKKEMENKTAIAESFAGKGWNVKSKAVV